MASSHQMDFSTWRYLPVVFMKLPEAFGSLSLSESQSVLSCTKHPTRSGFVLVYFISESFCGEAVFGLICGHTQTHMYVSTRTHLHAFHTPKYLCISVHMYIHKLMTFHRYRLCSYKTNQGRERFPVPMGATSSLFLSPRFLMPPSSTGIDTWFQAVLRILA